MSDAKEAGKARVAARILLASDDATEAVISQADTAGQAVRIWRVQRGMDADVDGLSEVKQGNRTLARSDADSRAAIKQMDDGELAGFIDLDVEPRARANRASKYAELEDQTRKRIRGCVVSQKSSQHITDSELEALVENDCSELLEESDSIEETAVMRTGRGDTVAQGLLVLERPTEAIEWFEARSLPFPEDHGSFQERTP